MKFTKFLFIFTIIVELFFISCDGDAKTSSTNTDSDTETELENIFKFSEDEKTITVDYENNTTEEKKFLVFPKNNIVYNFEGKIEVYKLDNPTPFSFGMLVDYVTAENDTVVYTNVMQINFLGNSLIHEGSKYTDYNYYLSRDGNYKSVIDNLIFEPVDTFQNHIITDDNHLLIENGTGTDISFKAKLLNNKNIDFYINGVKEFYFYNVENNPTKVGYFLIIPAGSTCHLKLTISDLK